mmetsp:Transcript_16722/g.29237  ORF Transcript_16722/g.29237 Transcript_16722/m.29237 type:complete len:335 (+) Transcript_16722:315-1319(+)
MDGKSSSPKTHSSSSSSSLSGKRPFFRKKLLASRIMGSRILRGKIPLSALAFTKPVQTFSPVLAILPPWLSRTTCSHSLQLSSPVFSGGTYAASASCSVPQEKMILPMWPEPPLRSSSVGSLLAFMASMHFTSKSRSPSGKSTLVQKNCRPPMSAAPSISTPRLPPSLMTFFSLSFFIFSNSSGVGSLASSFLSSFLASFSFFGSFLGAASFFGAASFLAVSFFGADSFLGAASFGAAPVFPPAPQSFTSPMMLLNSGWAAQRLNQRMRFPKGFRKASSSTSRMPSTSAQQTEMSAKVIVLPTMKVLWSKWLSSTVSAFLTSSLAQAVASGTSG